MVYIQSSGIASRAIPPTTSDDDGAAQDTSAFTSTFLVPVTSGPGPQGVASSARDNALSTDAPIVSPFRITALPPATTPLSPVQPKVPYFGQVNILYLLPLFITLGVVLGAITVAIAFYLRQRYRQHHSLRRSSTLLPGPPYVPGENDGDVEDRLLVVDARPSMEQVSLLAATPSTPSKFTVHGSKYVPPERTLGWKQVLCDVTQPQPLPISRVRSAPASASTQIIVPSRDGETFAVITHEQDDPFVTASPKVLTDNRVLGSVPRIRVSGPALARSISGEDDSDDRQPQERYREQAQAQAAGNDMSKPYRRSMIDILMRRGPYRPLPSACKEDSVLVPDDDRNNAGKENENHLPDQVIRAGSRKMARVGGGDVEDTFRLLGSRDDEERLEQIVESRPRQGGYRPRLSSQSIGEQERQRKVAPLASGAPSRTKEDWEVVSHDKGSDGENRSLDQHAKAPQRVQLTTPVKRSNSAACNGSRRGRHYNYRRSSAPADPDEHALVLPMSPPLATSQPLEKSLFSTSSFPSKPNHVSPLAQTSPAPMCLSRPTSGIIFSDDRRRRRRSVSPATPSPKGRLARAKTTDFGASDYPSLGSLSLSPTSMAIVLAVSTSSSSVSRREMLDRVELPKSV